MIRYILLLIGFSVFFLACTPPQKATEDIIPGLNLSNMDTSVRVQDDLFRFVNGGWIDRTVIPSDKGRWGAFDELRENNRKILLKLLTEPADEDDMLTDDQVKAIGFYNVGMDSVLAEQVGTTVLNSTFEKIETISSVSQLQDYLVERAFSGGDVFFNFNVFPDLKNSEKMAAYLTSGGLGLPERDYYIKTDDKSKETRAEYLRHVAKMFALVTGEGDEESEQLANKVMHIETKLAKATLTKEESRDMNRKYNKRSIAQLRGIIPSVDWLAYFQALGVKQDSIIVTEPAFMKACRGIFEGNEWESISAYLKWGAINRAANFLNKDVVYQNFKFYSNYLKEIDEIEPRWKRCLSTTNAFLGEALGQFYITEVFPEEAKKKAQDMVENIKLAMANRIKDVDWMSDSTKTKALTKLSSLTVKIGYPDEWKIYEDMIAGNVSYYQNVITASRFVLEQDIKKLDKPVNRKEWFMNPQTVNAYYYPLFNEIVFPAGILQPPFYNYQADEAVNYGGIGSVIGHEISHGFDDKGSQFDAEGNLKNWWQEDDLKKFKEKGQSLIKQFDAYEPLSGVFVQGEFTLGENIGDLCGVNVAYDALQRFLRENGGREKIDGYTPEQRFFLSMAAIWKGKITNEMLRTQVNTDPHSPLQYRVNGSVTNINAFYEAFDLKEGDALYSMEEDRVKVW